MREIRTRHYEGMFLLSQSVAADLNGAINFIKDTLTKNGAEIVSIKKWGDRQLAYPIAKQKRGTYILAYFSCQTDKVTPIERAFNLSDQVLRQLIISAEHLSVEEMQRADAQAELAVEGALRSRDTEVPAEATI
ncbi:MAG: 30S ribosomal protein S6 [Phycisphaerae bacterium]|nr:30S ribosomal protein S6 [Phycisphaerae bacterium]